MRLNGWQRIGILLSVLWALFLLASGLTGSRFVETIPGQDVSAAPGTPDRCTQIDPEPPSKPAGEGYTYEEVANGHRDANGQFCTTAHFIPGVPARVVRTPDQHRVLWTGWLFFTFTPIVVMWVAAYLLVWCFRWVAAGFRSKEV